MKHDVMKNISLGNLEQSGFRRKYFTSQSNHIKSNQDVNQADELEIASQIINIKN